ncbi:hypothetical protein Bca4012_041353 [Brassica carinata]
MLQFLTQLVGLSYVFGCSFFSAHGVARSDQEGRDILSLTRRLGEGSKLSKKCVDHILPLPENMKTPGYNGNGHGGRGRRVGRGGCRGGGFRR